MPYLHEPCNGNHIRVCLNYKLHQFWLSVSAVAGYILFISVVTSRISNSCCHVSSKESSVGYEICHVNVRPWVQILMQKKVVVCVLNPWAPLVLWKRRRDKKILGSLLARCSWVCNSKQPKVLVFGFKCKTSLYAHINWCLFPRKWHFVGGL